MVKKILIILLTVATVLCTIDPLSMLGAANQGWLPMEQTFLASSVAALILATILLWGRVRWVLPLVVAAYFVFGVYHAWKIYGTIRSENYSGPAVLVLLIFIGLCPFVAALVAAAWGGEFCYRTKHAG
jgi:hypothetical protein